MPLEILTPPQPHGLDDPTIAGLLSSLVNTPALNASAPFLVLQNFSVSHFLRYAGQAELRPDEPLAVDLFARYNDNVTLSIQSIRALQDIPPFLGNGEPYHVFVFAGAATPVPFQTAKLLSATFLKGFVTRLLLEKYGRRWAAVLGSTFNFTLTAAPPPTVPTAASGINVNSANPVPRVTDPPAPIAPMLASEWAEKSLVAMSKAMVTAGTWTALGQTEFCEALPRLTSASLQAVGMIKGWVAADTLIGAGADYDRCDPIIWRWLNSRYTTRELGAMVGYVLCYLGGFVGCERTQGLISGMKSPPAQLVGVANLPNIFQNLTERSHGRAATEDFWKDPVFQLSSGFFHIVNGEFYAVAQQAGFRNRLVALANYQAFINGYTDGLAQGADAMFAYLFDVGYGLGYAYGYSAGYASGFTAGYSQGYAAGWQEGYASGYSAGQPTWMTGLSNILGNLGTVVNTVESVGKLLGDAASAGQVIAGLF